MSTASTKLAELAFHERTEEAEAVAAFLMLRKKTGNNWRGVFSSSTSHFSTVAPPPPKKIKFTGTLQIQLPLKIFHKMVEFSSNNRKKNPDNRIDFDIISKNHNDSNPIIFEMVISCPSKMELEKTKNRIIAEINCLNLINKPATPCQKNNIEDIWDDFISKKAKTANYQKCQKSYSFNDSYEW